MLRYRFLRSSWTRLVPDGWMQNVGRPSCFVWGTCCISGENVPSNFLGNVTWVTSSSHIWHFAIYRYKCDASHCTLQLLPCWTWFQDIITNESWSSFYCHLVPDYPPYPHPLHKPLSLPSPPRVTIRCLVRATSLGNQWLWRPSSLAERLRGRSKKWVGPVYWWHENIIVLLRILLLTTCGTRKFNYNAEKSSCAWNTSFKKPLADNRGVLAMGDLVVYIRECGSLDAPMELRGCVCVFKLSANTTDCKV